MIPKVRGKFPQVIDSTILMEFVDCPTKGFYSFFRQLGSTEPAYDLICGGAFAKGLEVLRRAFYGEKIGLEKALEKGMLAGLEAYPLIDIPEHKQQKGPDRVATALAHYVQHWNPIIDHIQPSYDADGMPRVEYTFSIPLPIPHPETGQPIIYAGRFDMLGVYNGQLIVVDEKTTGQLGPTWSNKWNLRRQFTGYVWACQQYGLPVVGAIARGVAFYKETKANPSGHGFSESLQMRPQYMVDQWYEQTLRDIKRMIRAWEENWYDQDFGETCAAYSGCPFQTLCTSPEPEAWIPGRYGHRDWDPLAKNPEGVKEQKSETISDEMLTDFINKL